MIEQYLSQEQTIVIEKMTEARTVACTRFYGLPEVGRRIWMVRDWLLTKGIDISGPPSCIFYPAENTAGAASENALCEVQWDLPQSPGQSVDSTPGWEEARNGGAEEDADMPGLPIGRTINIKHVMPERVLSTLHRGDTDTIDQTLCFLEHAREEKGYEKAGPHREIYLFDVFHPKSMWMTEIQVPVKKVVMKRH